MTKEVYENILKRIDEDFEKKNLADLEKLKEYLDKKIEILDRVYLDTEKCYPILTMKLKNFLYKNIPSRGFKKVNFLIVVKEITKIDSYSDIYVFDTIGINSKLLLNSKRIGKQSLSMFEEALKSYGIDRNIPIQVEEIEKFNQYRKRNRIKRK